MLEPIQEGRRTQSMGWKNLGEKPVVHTPWFRLNLADVELPGGRRLDHYVLRLPPVVLAAVLDGEDRVLMLWRHRFIPDTYGWEIPSGIVDPAEDLAAAAAREAYKESGWEPQDLQPLVRLESASGLSDSVSHVYWTRQAIRRGDPPADFESERIDWVPLEQVPGLIAGGQIRSAVTATVLMMLLHRRLGED
jgi:8-oxo-dGTP pyrophosphatase MutT (NUDIX family)